LKIIILENRILNTKEVNMASTLIQFRIENDEKRRSSQILETMGLSLPAYLRICMIRLNKEKGIPFSMKLDDRIPEEGTGIELPS
jgi:DNA-damage-inducible protein J